MHSYCINALWEKQESTSLQLLVKLKKFHSLAMEVNNQFRGKTTQNSNHTEDKKETTVSHKNSYDNHSLLSKPMNSYLLKEEGTFHPIKYKGFSEIDKNKAKNVYLLILTLLRSLF